MSSACAKPGEDRRRLGSRVVGQQGRGGRELRRALLDVAGGPQVAAEPFVSPRRAARRGSVTEGFASELRGPLRCRPRRSRARRPARDGRRDSPPRSTRRRSPTARARARDGAARPPAPRSRRRPRRTAAPRTPPRDLPPGRDERPVRWLDRRERGRPVAGRPARRRRGGAAVCARAEAARRRRPRRSAHDETGRHRCRGRRRRVARRSRRAARLRACRRPLRRPAPGGRAPCRARQRR